MTHGERQSIPLGILDDPHHPSAADLRRAAFRISLITRRTWTVNDYSSDVEAYLFEVDGDVKVVNGKSFPDAVSEATGHPVYWQRA